MDEKQESQLFDIEREGRELADILKKIDENLLLDTDLGQKEESTAKESIRDVTPLVAPPDVLPLWQRVCDLRNLQAPYFILGGWLLSKIAYIMNIPIFIFGRKQEQFNRRAADILEGLIAQAEDVKALRKELLAQAEVVKALRKELLAQAEVVKELRGTEKWLKSVSEEARGTSEWVRLIEAKLMRLSLTVREQQDASAPSAVVDTIPEPSAPDQAALQQKIDAAGGIARVNLGCGEKPKPDYINVDRVALSGVDVVADIRHLPFEPGSLDEISSEHLVEHFREQQLRLTILPHWKKLLKPGGRLRIVCPNWQAMLDRLNASTMSLEAFKQVTFGAQDYEGDDHFSMYTPETLSTLLKDCGFTDITVVAAERMNGHCPEMELQATLA